MDLFDDDSSESEPEVPLKSVKRRRRALTLQPKTSENKENVHSNNRIQNPLESKMDESDKKPACLSLISYNKQADLQQFVHDILRKTKVKVGKEQEMPNAEAPSIKETVNKEEFQSETQELNKVGCETEDEDFDVAFEPMLDVLDFFKNFLLTEEDKKTGKF